MQLTPIKNLAIITCLTFSTSTSHGMAAPKRQALPTYQKIATAIESNDITQLKKIQFYPLSKDSILNLLELAICRHNYEAAQYIIANNVLALNTSISRLEDPRNSSEKVEFTVLETALIYHEDVANVNAPIIQLLLDNGANITAKAKKIASLAGKESVKPLICKQ